MCNTQLVLHTHTHTHATLTFKAWNALPLKARGIVIGDPGYGQDCHVDGPAERGRLQHQTDAGEQMACEIEKMMLKDRIRWKSRTGEARRIRRARRIRAVMDMENDNPSNLFLTNWRCNTCGKVLMHDNVDVWHCFLCEKEVPYEQVKRQRWQFGS